jgi:GNAT superfamily N-acetyltransferase
MRIQIAHDGDLDSVVTLLASQFQEHGIGLGLAALQAGVRGMLSDATRGVILLAYDAEPIDPVGPRPHRPVGVAVLAYTWTLEHGGRVAWLDELFATPERRGQGIGRALLRRAVEVAKEHGCRAVELEVDIEHARAERLYEREGFIALSRNRWARRLG